MYLKDYAMRIRYVLSKGAFEYGFFTVNTQVLLMRIIILPDHWHVLSKMWCKKRVSENDLLQSIWSVSRNYALF